VTRWVLNYRHSALDDLQSIFIWIEDTSGETQIAERFVERIKKRCEQLIDFPEMGPARDDLFVGLRMLTFEKSAVIFYRIGKDEVDILNVFYRVRDFDENSFTLQ
jgi:toxin ParE1/3/4